MGVRTTENRGSPEREAMEGLLARVASRDRDALGELYCCARGPVYALALGMLRNAQDAQDVTQDTFVRIWEAAPEYRPLGSPMAWVLTIARNLARMRLRQGGRDVSMTDEEWAAIPAEAPAVTAEDRHLLQTALAALDSQERQVVLLHAVAGLKHRETAKLLELPLSTVLSKHRRALQKMRALMEGDDAP